MTEAQTKAINKADAFFAFSREQFDEGKKDGIEYANAGCGMYCNRLKKNTLIDELEEIYAEGIKQDVKENGLTRIVKRELNNHEASYTGDIETTADALIDYPISKEQILKVFRNKKFVIEEVTA